MTEIEAFLIGIYIGISFMLIAGIIFGIYKLASNTDKPKNSKLQPKPQPEKLTQPQKQKISVGKETGFKFGPGFITTNITCSILILLGMFGSVFACVIIMATENPK